MNSELFISFTKSKLSNIYKNRAGVLFMFNSLTVNNNHIILSKHLSKYLDYKSYYYTTDGMNKWHNVSF
uniref:Uncharacterized protein n=1 Tax=viral metagenome TaxID=1070528 RepID=A0A6C0CL33_9ZZZZ